MDQDTAQVRFRYPQDWLDSLGGSTGEEFKKALNDQALLAEFIDNHYLEATQIDKSYFSNFHQSVPQFLPFIASPAGSKDHSGRAQQNSGVTQDPPAALQLTISGGWLIWLPLIALFLFLLFR